MEKARVQKFIAGSGYSSRRKAEELISQGKVSVNGKKVSLGDHCFENDEITVLGKKLKIDVDSKTYYVLNKPSGFVCSNLDKFNSRTVFDIVKDKGLFSVGRLDKDTTGLLILTNDGDFAQKVIHPSSKLEKEYVLKLNKELDIKSWRNIEKGLVLDGYQLSNCKISKISKFEYSIIIFEGRKRQIKRVFEMKGYKVLNLHRERIGNLKLSLLKLKVGEFKKVNKEKLLRSLF